MKIRNYVLSFTALVMIVVGVFFIFHFRNEKPIDKPRILQQDEDEGIGDAVAWLGKLRNDPQTRKLDAVAFLKARKEVAFGLQHQNKSLGLQWENMGPDNQGGRTRAILIDKNNPSILYAGGVSGGLWKSTTGGSSWNQIDSVSANLAISCIAQSANGTIYVGTGEGLATPNGTNANTGTIGGGMYKSTDGIDFTLIPSTIPTPNSNSVSWALINRIACDPVNSNRIYAATNTGFFISNDGGDTWKVVKYVLNSNYFNLGGEATDVKVGSDGSVATAVNSRCYTSDNGNDSTFISRSSTSPGSLPIAGIGRIELAIAPSNSSIMYCVAAKTDGSLENIYRSNDKGVSWYIIAPGGSTSFYLFGSNNQGWYDNVIAVYPNNPDMVLVGGIDMWKGLKVSSTGFFSWTQITSAYYVHVDHHGYYFHPNYPNPSSIYIGTDGGIFRSTNGGTTWQALNKNYTTF